MNVCPDNVFWTAGPLTTKLGMVMHHYELDCPPEGLLSSRSKSQWRMNHTIKILLSNISSELLILLQPDLVWWHIIIRWIVLWKDRIALLWSRSRSLERFKILVNVHLDNISSTAEPFIIEAGIVMLMHPCRAECHARRLVCCLPVQGPSEGSYNQIWLFLWYLLNGWSFCDQIYLDGMSS